MISTTAIIYSKTSACFTLSTELTTLPNTFSIDCVVA